MVGAAEHFQRARDIEQQQTGREYDVDWNALHKSPDPVAV